MIFNKFQFILAVPALVFILAGVSPLTVLSSDGEITSERTYNQKVYDLGSGQKKYQIHTAQIHYQDENGDYQNIDTSLTFDDKEKVYKHTKASYFPKLPEYADSWFEFYNNYQGADHTIKAKPQASHVKGEYFTEKDGSKGVLYQNAFGEGIDLKVYSYWEGLKKVIVINEQPKDTEHDLTFDFELDLPQGNKGKVKDLSLIHI